jgi:anaerobic ribonucleoside-triphosphate reductase activating protein
VKLSRLHHPVTVLGHGRRAGVWFQGCSIRCHGCVSQDTWDARDSHEIPVADVVAWIAGHADDLDGVTLTGGEPFDQPEALDELLTGLEALRSTLPQPLDLLSYSGYSHRLLGRRHPDLISRLDALISEPFVQHRATTLPLRGSSNQVLSTPTALGRERYASPPPAGGRRIQVSAQDDGLWYIGIPAPGDMERLDAMMRARGVVQGSVSWRP